MARNTGGQQALPAALLKLGLHFHRDIAYTPDTVEQLALRLADGFSAIERPVLRAFLTEIVASASAEELRRMWSTACVDWWFADGENVRRLITAVRDALGQGRTQPGWKPVGVGTNHARRVPAPKRR